MCWTGEKGPSQVDPAGIESKSLLCDGKPHSMLISIPCFMYSCIEVLVELNPIKIVVVNQFYWGVSWPSSG